MQSGLYHGYVGLVDGILRKMIDELGGSPRIIATGGLAPLIAKGSEFIQEVDETLTLEVCDWCMNGQNDSLSSSVSSVVNNT